MNNHEGSLITEDTEKMETIIKYVSSQGLYFLDSRTNANTKVPYVCQGLGFSWYERNVFLDNIGIDFYKISGYSKSESITRSSSESSNTK